MVVDKSFCITIFDLNNILVVYQGRTYAKVLDVWYIPTPGLRSLSFVILPPKFGYHDQIKGIQNVCGFKDRM